MRRFTVLLAVFLIPLLFSCALKPETEPVEKDLSLRAVIVSDLHFSQDPNVSSAVVAAMAYSREITKTIVTQVLSEQPDVLILTGDNTNSGGADDMRVLREMLAPVKEAGIPIVMTTGNHDFNRCTPKEYDLAYDGLIAKDKKDPASLSTMSEIGGLRILAMDDSSYDQGTTGTFSRETMQWLKAELKDAKANGKPVLFLSHHSVLPVTGTEKKDPNQTTMITNEDLLPLLKQYGVQLSFSGHIHSWMVLQDGDFHEVITGMPLMGAHEIGILEFEGNEVSYHAEKIDFEAYGEAGLADIMEKLDRQGSETMDEVFASILQEKGITGAEQQEIIRLIDRFFAAWQNSSLATEAEEIRHDPYYDRMIEALADTNYGPWMERSVNSPPENGKQLRFVW